jgi:hypothetical protein
MILSMEEKVKYKRKYPVFGKYFGKILYFEPLVMNTLFNVF